MNRALMNQNALPFVNPPSGPLASAPVASAGNQNMFYMSTDFGLCKYVSVFNNVGVDFVNFGRHAHILALLDPTKPSTVCATSKTSATVGSGYIWSMADSGSVIQNGLYSTFPDSPDGYGGAIGGLGIYTSPKVSTKSSFDKVALFTDGSTFAKVTDGTVIGSVGIGVLSSSSSLFICGRTDGASVNFEGQIVSIAFYEGYNANGSCVGLTLVDKIDFNKWDGSASGKSDMGYPYAVTKATPFTELSYACVPMSML